ncbi:MAG: RIP metalloprotease RseP [Deltaproteobacteria bacterium]|nr:RIP metalloprotease RseP [Deltaproteobacteria bacterium]
MTTLVSFAIVLGVLIFIHEFGHFVVAKLSGVRVDKFSLGFGPKLLAIKRGETEYRLSLLPLGGYVKMFGEEPGEEIPKEDRKRSFTHKSVGQKTAIVAAGPFMNLVLAAILMPLIYMTGIKTPAYLDLPAVVGFVAEGESASKAGLMPGDTIKEANGKAIPDWQTLIELLAMSPGKTIALKIDRSGEVIEKTLVPDASHLTGAGVGGFLPPMKPIVDSISPGWPAEKAGIKKGDIIVSIDGVDIAHWALLEALIHKNGVEKSFVIKRGEETKVFKITPKYNEDTGLYLIGITRLEEMVIKKYGFFEAIKQGLHTARRMIVQLFSVITGLIFGDYSIKTLGGPIMIAVVAGGAAESGVTDLLWLIAFLSIQLGIINLFPIPVLDGGHLVFFAIEFIRGKPLNEKTLVVAQQIGFALLIALIVVVTYNDILRFLY